MKWHTHLFYCAINNLILVDSLKTTYDVPIFYILVCAGKKLVVRDASALMHKS